MLLSDSLRQRGYFHESVVRRLLDEHTRGVRSWHDQLWNLLMLEPWFRVFVDRRPSGASAGRSHHGTTLSC